MALLIADGVEVEVEALGGVVRRSDRRAEQADALVRIRVRKGSSAAPTLEGASRWVRGHPV